MAKLNIYKGDNGILVPVRGWSKFSYQLDMQIHELLLYHICLFNTCFWNAKTSKIDPGPIKWQNNCFGFMFCARSFWQLSCSQRDKFSSMKDNVGNCPAPLCYPNNANGLNSRGKEYWITKRYLYDLIFLSKRSYVVLILRKTENSEKRKGYFLFSPKEILRCFGL